MAARDLWRSDGTLRARAATKRRAPPFLIFVGRGRLHLPRAQITALHHGGALLPLTFLGNQETLCLTHLAQLLLADFYRRVPYDRGRTHRSH